MSTQDRTEYRDDEDYDDDGFVPVTIVKSYTAHYDPSIEEQRSTKRLMDSVETYIERCSAVMGYPPAAAEYLRLMPFAPPMTQLFVGQSPYNYKILPRFASAMAFSYAASQSWTPTVQVMSQAMRLFHGVPISDALDVLAHTYLLLPRGIIFLNVYPYSDLDAMEKAKCASYFAELVGDLLMCSHLMTTAPCSTVEMGDEPTSTMDSVWSSTKSVRRLMSRISAKNPVWVARNFKNAPVAVGPKPSRASTCIDRAIGPMHDCALASNHSSCHKSKWKRYQRHELLSLQPEKALARISAVAKSECITGLSSLFESLLQRASAMAPNRDRKGKKPDTRQAHGVRPQAPESEAQSYQTTVFEYLMDKSQDAYIQVAECKERLISIESRLRPEDRATVESNLAEIDDIMAVISKFGAFFGTAPGVLTSARSAMTLTSNTVPPIVRGTPAPAVDPIRISALSDVESEDDKKVTDASTTSSIAAIPPSLGSFPDFDGDEAASTAGSYAYIPDDIDIPGLDDNLELVDAFPSMSSAADDERHSAATSERFRLGRGVLKSTHSQAQSLAGSDGHGEPSRHSLNALAKRTITRVRSAAPVVSSLDRSQGSAAQRSRLMPQRTPTKPRFATQTVRSSAMSASRDLSAPKQVPVASCIDIFDLDE